MDWIHVMEVSNSGGRCEQNCSIAGNLKCRRSRYELSNWQLIKKQFAKLNMAKHSKCFALKISVVTYVYVRAG